VATGDGNNDKIWAVVYIAAMGWGTPVSVEPNASTGASGISFMPQIKFDAGGNAIAVWARGDSTMPISGRTLCRGCRLEHGDTC